MTSNKQHLVNCLLVGGLLVAAAVSLSANWLWLASLLIGVSVMIIAPKPLS